jgi:hypothetical protein
MKCEAVQELLLTQDNDTRLPQEAEAHIAECKSCARMASELRAVSAALSPTDEHAVPFGHLSSPETTEQIMGRIERVSAPWELAEESYPPIRLGSWLVGGVALLSGALAFRFSPPFEFLAGTTVGSSVDLAVTLATGFSLTVYVALFAIANHNRIQRVLHIGPRS